jgi:hypothetical protein
VLIRMKSTKFKKAAIAAIRIKSSWSLLWSLKVSERNLKMKFENHIKTN